MGLSVSRFNGISIKHRAFKPTKLGKPGFVALLGIMAVLMFSSVNALASSDDHSSSKNRPVIYNTPQGLFEDAPALEINGINLHDGVNDPTVTLSGLPVAVLAIDTEGKQVIIEIPADILNADPSLLPATHFLTLDYYVPDHDGDKDDDGEDDDDDKDDDKDDDDDKLKSRHVVFYPYLIKPVSNED